MHPEYIGQYKIERKIGSGGMGTVYLAHHEKTGDEVALKVLSAALAREEGYVARFTREIEALQKLSNPHIVKVFDSGIEGETYYFAMEYVEGETLTMRLRREKKIPWREVIGIAIPICSALKAAHDAGIIHRDLKPSNLLLSKQEAVKLTDFGVAQVFAGRKLTATGGVLGTAEYMSPEQAVGQRTTKKSDLYSLGAVMYTMLTGRPPFTGNTAVEIMQKHRYGVFDKPKMYVKEIPFWLEELVCQLLNKDPDERVPDALVLSKMLHEILKKVEISDERQTRQIDIYDGDAPTIDAVANQGGGDFILLEDRGPGAATFMRDMVRYEAGNAKKTTVISNVFDNIWVLLFLLALVIGGGVYFFQDRKLTSQQKFDAGVLALSQPESHEWLLARDEYFLPISQEDTWNEKVAPYLKKIKLYEIQRVRQPHSLIQKKTYTEPERFMSVALDYEQRGELSKAITVLESIIILTKDQAEHQIIFQLATDQLDAIQQEKPLSTDQEIFLKATSQNAIALKKKGLQKEANEIWQSIIHLYSHNPAASDFVKQAHENLKE